MSNSSVPYLELGVADESPSVEFVRVRMALLRYLKAAPIAHAVFRACELAHLKSLPLARPVLDLGCGRGQLAQLALDSRIDVGLDISARQLAGARHVDRYERLVLADAAEMALCSGCIQTVVALSSLEHMRRPEKIMAEVARVLRPGGMVVATITLPELRQHLFWPAVARRLRLGWLGRLYVTLQDRAFAHRTMLGREEWEGIARDAGLEIVVSRRIVPPAVIRRWDALLPLALPYWLLSPLGIRTVFPWPGRKSIAGWGLGAGKRRSAEGERSSASRGADAADGPAIGSGVEEDCRVAAVDFDNENREDVLLLVARKPKAK
jgi:SAM-dependent methyltransferase